MKDHFVQVERVARSIAALGESLTLGHTLATLPIGALWRGGYLALFHLAMAACVTFALVHLFGLEDTPRGVFVLQCMMPVSVATHLYIEMYQTEHAQEVAGLILISTRLAMIVLPPGADLLDLSVRGLPRSPAWHRRGDANEMVESAWAGCQVGTRAMLW